MFLHYLGNHEPRKLVFLVMLKNDTALVCYIFNIHRPMLATAHPLVFILRVSGPVCNMHALQLV